MAEEAKWYVVHTYSGYENKVKADIEKTIENRNLQDQILEVLIPLQTVVEEKNGEKKQVQKKMFPAYVLINMIMNDQTWYVVRNTWRNRICWTGIQTGTVDRRRNCQHGIFGRGRGFSIFHWRSCYRYRGSMAGY